MANTTIQVMGRHNQYTQIEADYLFVCEFAMNIETIHSKKKVIKHAHFYLREINNLSGGYVPISFHIRDKNIMYWPTAKK